MNKHAILTGILVEEGLSMTFVEVCQKHAIAEDWLLEMLEEGLLADISVAHKALSFTGADLQRILAAYRLHRDLGINASGVIVAIELLDELAQLQEQLRMLQRYATINQ